MKKSIKCIISIALAVALTLGLCVGAFADSSGYKGYDKYVCLGDSIAAGYGPYSPDSKGLTRVDVAYHSIIADSLGAELVQLGHCGFRLNDLRYIFEDDYTPDALLFMSARTTEARERLEQLRLGAYRSQTADADLVTLNVGMNDIMTYAFLKIVNSLSSSQSASESAAIASQMIESSGGVSEALKALLEKAEQLKQTTELVSSFVKGMQEGYELFYANWNHVIKDIYSLNPDVTLVVIGLYNPFTDTTLVPEGFIPIGRAADRIAEKANSYIKLSAQKYGYIYADVMGVPTCVDKAFTEGGFTDTMMLDVHPTVEGHRMIADKVLSLLPDKAPRFADVTAEHWAYDEIAYVSCKGYMLGTGGGMFSPQGSVTRGMLATILYRMSGSPEINRLEMPFYDVAEGRYCSDAVIWAYKEGVIRGYADGSFRPDECITRQQLAAMLYRFSGSPAVEGALDFTDAGSIAEYAHDAVIWASGAGIVCGYADGSFAPALTANRAQLAAMIARLCRAQ